MKHSLSLSALLLAGAVLPPNVTAQSQPVIIVRNVAAFEGNSGSTLIIVPIELKVEGRPSPFAVTGTVSTAPFTLGIQDFQPATPGTDFIPLVNQPFVIPAGQTNTSVTVLVPADTTVEPNEGLQVILTSINGETLNLTGGAAPGLDVDDGIATVTIVDDDRPPTINIYNASVTEPLRPGLTRNLQFRVRLSHPAPLPVTVAYSTAGDTATAGADFQDTGSIFIHLTIPAGASSGTIEIPIFGDFIAEPAETLAVRIQAPIGTDLNGNPIRLNGVIQNANAIVRILDSRLTTGAFDFSPSDARVLPEVITPYTITWTVPDGEVWHDLRTIDLLIHDDQHVPLWVRWDEAANTFSIAEKFKKHHDRRRARHHDNDECGNVVEFGPGASPGSSSILETHDARLHLSETSVRGSGPDGLTVTLQLGISFTREAAGRCYDIELTASDDLGNEDDFVPAGGVTVGRPANEP